MRLSIEAFGRCLELTFTTPEPEATDYTTEHDALGASGRHRTYQ